MLRKCNVEQKLIRKATKVMVFYQWFWTYLGPVTLFFFPIAYFWNGNLLYHHCIETDRLLPFKVLQLQ